MSKFVGGFVVASVLWGAVFALYVKGIWFRGDDTSPVTVALAPDAGTPDEAAESASGRRRARSGTAGASGRGGSANATGSATSGDDLGENDPRNLDMGAGGGEQQLSGAQIERGMDAVFPRIRRCFVLASGEGAVQGKLVFGLRIEPSGKVSRVSLNGPASVTTGEAGSCLQGAAKAATFPAFNGPPMVARYPVTLE